MIIDTCNKECYNGIINDDCNKWGIFSMGNGKSKQKYSKEDLKKIKNLEQKLDEATKENWKLKECIEKLKNENRQLKESVNNQAKINDTKHSVNGAGRKPKSEEEIQKQLEQIKSFLSDGMKEKEICKQMDISRSTYYRLKRHEKCHK